MKKLWLISLCLSLCFWFGLEQLSLQPVAATELVYTPINPAFGGSPFNGQWLLNSAQAQNKFEASRRRPYHRTPLKDRLERELVDWIFDKIFDREGSLDLGASDLEVYTDEINITVEIYQYGEGNYSSVNVDWGGF